MNARGSRRRFVASMCAASLLGPLPVQADQPVRRLGWLGYASPGPNPINEAIFAELRQLGWTEGETVNFERRFAERDPSRLPRLAAELANRQVDLIIAATPLTAAAAQQATQSIPIIGLSDDMQASGLVPSVARPGGNVSGVSMFSSELDPKRLALLSELIPQGHRIAALAESAAGPSIPKVKKAAHDLGIEVALFEAGSDAKIGPALDSIIAAKVDGVNVLASAVFHNGRQPILVRMEAARLPAIYQWPEYASAEGALVGYGPRQALIGQLVAQQIDRVLRGTPIAELPVVQPTRFDLAINLQTARTLDITVTPALLARADEVID